MEKQSNKISPQNRTSLTQALIFAINLTSFYYEVYTEKGILVGAIDFSEMVN